MKSRKPLLTILGAIGLLVAACAAPTPAETAAPTAQVIVTPSEFVGQITEISGETWLVGGLTLIVDEDTELNGTFAVGDMVRVHFVARADGSLVAVEIEPATGDDANSNTNTNENSNANSNSNGNANSNSNSNANGNSNGNSNDNDDDDDDNSNSNDNDDD